ncbi:hypothetical protein EDB83DRAFT_2315115 [Lactarius deliciosus]|nr:hypothetical protein EDB83DRAFT_2315115 [Lactarius deliciosus]
MGPLAAVTERTSPDSKRGPPVPRMFGAAATEYFRKYGGGEHLAKIAAKDHKHSVNNPYAQFRAGTKLRAVYSQTRHSCTLTDLKTRPSSLSRRGSQPTILTRSRDEERWIPLGHGMTRRLADKIFAQAGASRDDVGVVELHDCFATNELVTYPALGLCAVDDAHRFVERGDNTRLFGRFRPCLPEEESPSRLLSLLPLPEAKKGPKKRLVFLLMSLRRGDHHGDAGDRDR